MVDFSAIAKWPNVPACYGWLSLDRRGSWRLQGEPVTHGGLLAFLNQHYACDDNGCWFVQNGPQRVFVELACTPWIFRLHNASFTSHTGRAAGEPSGIGLDQEGSIYLETPLGPGLLDDRDLPAFLAQCTLPDGGAIADETWLDFIAGSAQVLYWGAIPLSHMTAEILADRHGFIRSPAR